MNIAPFIPALSSLAGRDVEPDFQAFFRARAAVGAALNEDQRAFFMANWRTAAEFMETDRGQQAIREFVSAWMKPDEVAEEKPSPKARQKQATIQPS